LGSELRGAKATVMGLGLFGGGLAVARWLAKQGADVLVTDLRDAATLDASLARLRDLPIRYRLGEHCESDFTSADVVVANPAVDPNSPFLAAARARGVVITSELDLFLRACPSREVLAVTGTNGKTTTTTLLGNILGAARRRVFVGGNIGRSLLDRLGEIDPNDPVVLEISSYQLESLAPPAPFPRVAVVTNLSPDHLERHGTMERYAAAKRRLVESQDSACDAVLNLDDARVADFAMATRAEVRFFARKRPADYCVAERSGARWLVESWEGRETPILETAALRVPGDFHHENILAAVAAARAVGAPMEAIRPELAAFRGVAHRLQALPPIAGIAIYDNAVSTVPESTISAIEALPRGIRWIAGGKTKHLDLAPLARLAAERCPCIYSYGDAGPELARALEQAGGAVVVCATLAQAFERARRDARPGEALLYSPAFPSFDQYRNFTERGAEFLSLVNRWRGEAGAAPIDAPGSVA
jgi:UDP-N-acetylmuramoylalanine--D-glutamate ligase